jgi:imidazoleglycerol phosphate synthase cyclase subunit
VIKRVAARFDLKGPDVIKGVQMEGLRRIGPVETVVESIAAKGIDELILIDAVASLYGQSAIYDAIQFATRNLFLPVTAGGGIKTVEDAHRFIDAGADRVSINSATFMDQTLLEKLATVFGAQAVVVSIEAKQVAPRQWRCYFESGRQDSGVDLREKLASISPDLVGEILLTSVDKDGMNRGPDLELVGLAGELSEVPLVYSGGIESIRSAMSVMEKDAYSCIALSSAIHRNQFSISNLKTEALSRGLEVRTL